MMSDLEYGGNSDEPLHVHDLPQIYTRPSLDVLVYVLRLLTYTPPTLSLSSAHKSPSSTTFVASRGRRRRIHPTGITQYLTTIVASPLQWLGSDADREEVWALAAKRLSERAGRAAAGDMVRKFRVPLSAGEGQAGEASEIELTLHEPSIVEDNLGMKTWASSLVLASKLRDMRRWLPSVESCSGGRLKVLELGSGTGLLGLAAAAVWPECTVKLTDLEAIVQNLTRNVQVNAAALSSCRSELPEALAIETAVLDWSLSPPFNRSIPTTDGVGGSQRFDIILASDPLYSHLHPPWLVNTIASHISTSPNARVMAGYPLRKGYEQEREDFERQMSEMGMRCVYEDVVTGVKEDWGDGEDEQDEDEGDKRESVKYGVWRWPEAQ